MLAYTLTIGFMQALTAGPPAAKTIEPPRMEAGVSVDGELSEPEWARAQRLDRFQQYLPVDGRRAADSTVVYVWYSPTAIHFGVRAYADPAAVRATLADRDKIAADDQIHIVLDTFNDRRQAFAFGVNPLGVQSDGMLEDVTSRPGGGFSGGTTRQYGIDANPDFVYQSSGRVTDFGYEVELSIPFKTIRYQTAERQTWGLNVIRRIQASGFEDTWSPVSQGNNSFLGQSGSLTGMTGLRRGIVLDVNPEVTSSVNGSPGTANWSYDGGSPRVGGNVRWGITNNLTANGTVNPDFSQVEADIAQVQYDPRQALFFPEKRPFFLDGLELFSTPSQLIYTRRIADPVAAGKMTGKISGNNVALITAADARSTSRTGANNPVYNLLRVRRDLPGQSTIGLSYTDRVDGSDFNRVGAVDGRFVFAGNQTLTFQAGGSLTSAADVTTSAPLWRLSYARAGRRFGLNYSLRGIHSSFRAGSGFIARPGIVHSNLSPSLTFYGRPGATLERWSGSIALDGTWDYDRFFDGNTPNDSKLHFNGSFQFKGGWNAGASLLFESFKYPAELYRDYAIEQTRGSQVDTVAFTGTNRLFNLDLVASAGTPRFQNFSGSVFVIAGQDENFFEWASAYIFFTTVNLNWRPSEQARIDFLYNHQHYIRPDDWSTVGRRKIPRLRVEYQLSRSVFFRVVGQYDAGLTDALHDDSRTESPVLIFDAGAGRYVPAARQVRNDVRIDWLFSYRPRPGTVFFAGYGSSLEEDRAFRFSSLDRTSDGLFVKLSYLFRAS